MNKIIVTITLIALMFFAASSAFAAGGKVRGEKGQGRVEQIQVRNSSTGNFVF